MAERTTVKWVGKSKKEYTYYVYKVGEELADKAGNYIFAKSVAGKWRAVYIGESSDLNDRTDLESHHKGACIKRNGATHVHAHLTSGGEKVRRAEESDLLDNRDPVCND